jgi:uncharacterized membrane protein YeiH
MELYYLDLFGTLGFAAYGSYIGIKNDFDLFGIFILSLVTALGGGTIRDLILNQSPIYFNDINYIFIVLIGVLIAVTFRKNFLKLDKLLRFVDSIGLVTFTIIGLEKAAQAGFNWFGIIAIGVISATFGGVLRDIIINKKPEIFHRDFYATVSIIIGAIYILGYNYYQEPFFIIGLLTIGLIIRLLAITFKFKVWKP